MGIRKESEEYYKVQEILAERKLPFSLIMKENSLNSNYVKVNVGGIENVDSLSFVRNINGTSLKIPFTLEQKNAVKSVFKLYSNDSKIKQELNNTFIEEWNKHSNLFKLKEWWEKLPYSFSVTSVGKVLAHANAQRCDKSLPSLN